MDTSRQIGSEMFRRLDAFMSEPVEEIVETREWLSLLTAADWRLLASIWRERSVEWRACLVCVVGEFPGQISEEMQRILRLGVADSNYTVAANAAIWLCHHILDHPETVRFDRGLIPRLRELLRGESGSVMNEVSEVLREHGEAG